MGRLTRRLERWRDLPAVERRLRASALVERALRRHPRVRRLNLSPDPPRWRRFQRALSVARGELAARLAGDDPRRGPLFARLDARVEDLARRHPSHVADVLQLAAATLERRFDLLGSGPARPLRPDGGLDWHRDWRSGLGWPADAWHRDLPLVRGDGSDVRVAWELSRFQHLIVLGQARRLAAERAAAPADGDLERRCGEAFRAQVTDWIAHNPRGVGIHWSCSMEVALRAMAWISGLALMRGAPGIDERFVLELARALWVHGRHIRRHLEIGPGGRTTNHFLCDALGLLALGCALPELDEADEWRTFGWRALQDQIEVQVHPDGVDFERSIPYHRLATEVFLQGALLARGTDLPAPGGYLRRLHGMLEFVAAYTRPDGTTPQWGDNDDGRVLPLAGHASAERRDHRELLALGGRLLDRPDLVAAAQGRDIEALWLLGPAPPPARVPAAGQASRGFAHAGYYVLRDADLHSTVSCGRVGTAGLGNHSHNDLLALTLWAAGREWICDPGTGTYSANPALRNRLRSTAAHATLQLGDREQNDLGAGVDGLFRLHERARPAALTFESGPRGARIVAHHDGYSRPGDPWIHERSVRLDAAARAWIVADLLARPAGGAAPDPAEPTWLRFGLAPDLAAAVTGAWPRELEALALRLGADPDPDPARVRVAVLARAADGARLWIGLDLPPGSRVAVEEALDSPRYGITLPAPVVVARIPAAIETRATSVLWPAPRTAGP